MSSVIWRPITATRSEALPSEDRCHVPCLDTVTASQIMRNLHFKWQRGKEPCGQSHQPLRARALGTEYVLNTAHELRRKAWPPLRRCSWACQPVNFMNFPTRHQYNAQIRRLFRRTDSCSCSECLWIEKCDGFCQPTSWAATLCHNLRSISGLGDSFVLLTVLFAARLPDGRLPMT